MYKDFPFPSYQFVHPRWINNIFWIRPSWDMMLIKYTMIFLFRPISLFTLDESTVSFGSGPIETWITQCWSNTMIFLFRPISLFTSSRWINNIFWIGPNWDVNHVMLIKYTMTCLFRSISYVRVWTNRRDELIHLHSNSATLPLKKGDEVSLASNNKT